MRAGIDNSVWSTQEYNLLDWNYNRPCFPPFPPHEISRLYIKLRSNRASRNKSRCYSLPSDRICLEIVLFTIIMPSLASRVCTIYIWHFFKAPLPIFTHNEGFQHIILLQTIFFYVVLKSFSGLWMTIYKNNS